MQVAQNEHQDKERSYLSVKDRVINVLSPFMHEVRGPIVSMVAYVDIVAGFLKAGMIKEAQEAIEETKEISQTFEKIYARFQKSVNAGTPDISAFEPNGGELCSVQELFTTIGRMLRPLAAQKNISVRTGIDKGMPLVVYTDTTYLLQIITNLAINAIKFSPAGSIINLACTLSPDNNTFSISVEDHGQGIPPSEIEKIFDAGYRLNSAAPGQGLGLSIVKNLVEILKGTITVDSRLNKGSKFTVTLPLLPFY